MFERVQSAVALSRGWRLESLSRAVLILRRSRVDLFVYLLHERLITLLEISSLLVKKTILVAVELTLFFSRVKLLISPLLLVYLERELLT